MITMSLLALLTTFMKFCDKKIIDEILKRNKGLLDITDQCLTFYTNSKDFGENFKASLELFNTLLFALSKFELYTMRNKRKIDKFNDDEYHFEIEENQKINQKQIKIIENQNKITSKKEKKKTKYALKEKELLKKQKKKLNQKLKEYQVENLLKMPQKLNKLRENFKFYDLCEQEKNNLNTILQEKDEKITKINKTIIHLKSLLKEKKNFMSNLFNINKRLEQEKSELNQKISKILEENEETMKILSQQLKLKEENNSMHSK